jgi:CspA family cold shock protein
MANPGWYVGLVKFFDANKGFGFIKDVATGKDYFIHVSRIEAGPIGDNEVVIFQLRPSRSKPGTLEAAYVWKVARFKANIEFLVAQISRISNLPIRKVLLGALPDDRRLILLEEHLAQIGLVSKQEEYQTAFQQIQQIKTLFEGSISGQLLSDALSEKAYANSDDSFKVKFWLIDIILRDLPIALLRATFLQESRPVQEKIYHKLSPEQRLAFFVTFVKTDHLAASVHNLFFFLFFDRSPNLQRQFIQIYIDTATGRLSSEDGIKYYQQFEHLLPLIDENTKRLLVSYLLQIGPDIVKLKLWLHDHVLGEDYELYHANFVFLTIDEQTRYIKKLFFLLSKKTPGIDYAFIQRLANLTHSYADGQKYDLHFSGNVVLQAIESIRLGTFPTEEAIFATLTRQVDQNTTALLSLSGFFELCPGRSLPDQTTVSEDGQKSIVSLVRKGVPKHVTFCEGVKFGADGKDKTYRHDAWWCRRYPCFEPNQELKLPEKYVDFTLSSFLLILDLPFDHNAYVDFLGLLNKINVFLKHLQCRTCGHTLKPAKEGYYSYYRISNFVCANQKCSNKDNIYLNHCLSGRRTAIKSRCDNLIDSRVYIPTHCDHPFSRC